MMMFEKFTLLVLISAVGAKITKDPFPLKVLSLNTWGMPDSGLSHMLSGTYIQPSHWSSSCIAALSLVESFMH